jgi:hypothetical protein
VWKEGVLLEDQADASTVGAEVSTRGRIEQGAPVQPDPPSVGTPKTYQAEEGEALAGA